MLPQNRRQDLKQAGHLGLGLLVWVLLGCKTKKKRSNASVPTSSLTPTPGGDTSGTKKTGTTETDKTKPNATDTKETTAKCSNYLDTSSFPPAKENLEPKMKLYGDSSSSLLVIALPKYVHGNLLSVYVVREKGEVIAQKGVSSFSDINPDLSLRPICFDNLQLKSEKRLILIFETSCQNCSGGKAYYKYIMPEDLTFESQFLGKPAYGLAPTYAPQNFYRYQGFADFLPQDSDFDTSSKYYYQLLTDEAHYDAVGGLVGFVITDLFGNILSQDGKDKNNKNWADIINYPTIICYKLVGDQFYVRTLLRLS